MDFRMKAGFIAAILFLIASASLAGDGDEAKFSKEAEKTAGQLRETIRTELKSLGNHPWAGEYHSSLVSSDSLLIGPKAGYVFESYCCLGLHDRNYGKVAISSGKLRLSLAFKNQTMPEELVPIAWEQRSYLVPSNEVLEFCNDMNSGFGGLGRWLQRSGDQKEPVSGLASVPAEYRGYLLKEPVAATIIAIGPVTTFPSEHGRCEEATVILDAGKDKGLLKGMQMYVVEPECAPAVITVVEDHKSQAVMTRFVDGSPGADPPPIRDPPAKIGWKLSTSLVVPNTQSSTSK
jgi:hypothetical protein